MGPGRLHPAANRVLCTVARTTRMSEEVNCGRVRWASLLPGPKHPSFGVCGGVGELELAGVDVAFGDAAL
jgi:hypothetical protein